MNNIYKRNLFIGFGLSLLILMISSIASYMSITNLLTSMDAVNHTNLVKQNIEKVLSLVKDAETGQRGFLLTNNPDFLEPYNGSREEAFHTIATVEALTSDNPIQQDNCVQLRILTARRYDKLEKLIELKKTGTIEDGMLETGKLTMRQIRSLTQQMQDIEDNLLAKRTERLNRSSSFTPVIIISAAIIAFLITIFFYLRVKADFDQRIKLNNKLLEKEEDISKRIHIIQGIAEQISNGDYSIRTNDEERDSLGTLSAYLNKMAQSLEHAFNTLHNKEWMQSGIAGLNDTMVGEKTPELLASDAIEFISLFTSSQVGAVYLCEDTRLRFTGSYAFKPDHTRELIRLNEGFIGQCAASGKEILLTDIPGESVSISFAAANINPKSIIVYPIYHEKTLKGVIEIGALHNYTQQDLELLRNIAPNIGVGITTAQNRRKMQELLEETQAQSEELQVQHKELEELNTEMEAQTQKLQVSEEELKVQQEELLQSNHELEQRTRLLEEKNDTIVERNLEIEKKAEELAQSTKYKSEFLANMSHELRTPLNSILLLSRLMSENTDKSLNDEQVEYARVIQSSGNGLLNLIDEILDLSKIEAGKMDLDYTDVPIKSIVSDLEGMFRPLAKNKNISFKTTIGPNVPNSIYTDRMRLDQILKNLLSNALKFTSKGYISLEISKDASSPMIQFHVKDTGIGIPADKQALIFEAFRQADGSTRRKFGGTGLGLSISRELARLLKGEISLRSVPEEGSEFTVSLPGTKHIEYTDTGNIIAEEKTQKEKTPEPVSKLIAKVIPESIPDDRDTIGPHDKVILIVEDDVNFASLLMKFARAKGYKTVVIVRGDEVMNAVNTYKPSALLLDIVLPVKSGWEVIEELKNDPYKRHIPVHIMSSLEMKKESLMRGAVDFINKPFAMDQMQSVFSKLEGVLQNEHKKVIIIEENPKHARALAYYLEHSNVTTEIAQSVQEGISSIKKEQVNCVILDMGIPANSAYETLELVKKNPELEHLPVIIFTGKSLSRPEEMRIRQYADSIVVKTAHSYQRILDEVAIFLHMVEEQSNGRTIRKPLAFDEVLKNKKVLIADDDVRNIYSISKALEKHKMQIIPAIDGKEALRKLEENPDIDIILMDMMMPELDGYETTTRIRKENKYDRIPILAVTAKAMMGDREKCISAGASDYISKPIDIDQLVSLLRVWLYDKL